MFQLFLKNKKAIGLTVAVPLLALVMLAAGILLARGGQDRFARDGSVYEVSVAEDSTATVSPTYFSAGTALQRSASATVSFRGEDGETDEVGTTSFVHYADGAITSVDGMVLTDLADFPSGWMDSYYLDSLLALEYTDGVYTIENNTTELSFEEFLLKTGDDDYLIASPTLTLSRADGSESTVEGGFLELHYLDSDAVAVRATDGTEAWQFLADGATVTLDNGAVLELGTATINSGVRDEESGEYTALLALLSLTVSSENAVRVESASYASSSGNWVEPTFHFTAVDGESGADGADGDIGEDGDSGESGTAGNAGASGEDGTDGGSGGSGGSGTGGTAGRDGEGTDSDEFDLSDTPYVNIVEWDQTAGTVDFSLRVYNSSLIKTGSTDMYILNVATGAVVTVTPQDLDLGSCADGVVYGTYSATVEPDTEYRLIISAQVLQSESDDGSTTYAKSILVSRTFRTDTNGFNLKKVSADYITADNIDSYDSYAKEDSACLGFTVTLSGNQTIEKISSFTIYDAEGTEYTDASYDDDLTVLEQTAEDGSVFMVYGLKSNTEYTFLVEYELTSGSTGSFTGTWTTLKATPTVTDVVFDYNEKRFFISSVTCEDDPDDAVAYYTHEIYRYYDDGLDEDNLLKSKVTTDESAYIYLNGSTICSGTDKTTSQLYYYGNKVYVTWYDNEKYVTKEVEQSSSWSAQNIPDTSSSYVQFVEATDSTDSGVTTSQIDGYLVLYTGDNQTIYCGDSDMHRILVQISAAGNTDVLYYYDLTDWTVSTNNTTYSSVKSGTTSFTAYGKTPRITLTGLSQGTTYTVTVTAYFGSSSSTSSTVGSTWIKTETSTN
ncbi:MAG: hypothetical protein LUE24_14775 [Lachnospiraceae bacterium]|nr:hypothetical protein [Lachnospiraceae bacterium]